MAHRYVTTLVDDMNGMEAAGTHVIEVDGHRVEIDLTQDNYAALMAFVAPYLDAGRKIGRTYTSPRVPRGSVIPQPRRHRPAPDGGGGDVDLPPVKVLRNWWKTNADKIDGLAPFKADGRIPARVEQAWRVQRARVRR